MIIEIRKAGFVNKGAELMLYSVMHKLREVYPDVIFVMTPNLIHQPYEKRAKLGIYQKPHAYKYRIQWAVLCNMLPKNIRNMYGIIIDKEVDVVIDAAGFYYSDQWGKSGSRELANSSKTWKNNGTKVILMPQAFGPFSSESIKSSIKKAADNIDLIFAREQTSYKYLTDITGERENIKLSPDFTNLLDGIVPVNFDFENNHFCIIPNYRMIDKVSKKESKAYLPFLIKCTKYLLKKNKKPFILVHEGKDDVYLANKINEAVGGNLPIVFEDDALKIKGIIGVSKGTLGSRFHGIVSALSQGVPTLATGWSHKYKMLFEDYNFPQGLINVMLSDDEIYKMIDLVTDEKSKNEIKNTLLERSLELKNISNQMWNKVIEVIDKK